MLLPRERLLLSYLDLSAPTGELPYARSYESHVKILDLEARMGTRPVVLVARSCCSSSEGPSSSAPSYVYVLERQSDGLYSLCRLGSWVDLAALARDATVCCWQRIPRAKGDAHEGGGSEASSRPLITPHLHKELKKKRLAIEALQSVVRKPPRSVEPVAATTAMTSQHTMEKTLVSGSREQQSSLDTQQSPMVKRDEIRSKKPQEPRTPANNPTSTEQTQPNTAESIFSNIRSQYIDALYHSMVSRAYKRLICAT